MKRTRMNDLISLKHSLSRKPLIIKGVRQVGKTWLMKEFGSTQYKQTIYLNFEKNKHLRAVFSGDIDINRIRIALQAESGLIIEEGNTLLVFDEIQAVPEAITALKYFHEDAPGFHVIAAGSLLGLALHENVSFPVGNVEFLNLYPFTYLEFLEAMDEHLLVEMLQTNDWKMITAYGSKFTEYLRQYFFVGGMPEAIIKYHENNSFREVRHIQKQILDAYDQDFSKHAPIDIVPRIRIVWNSIPVQLTRENRKFMYGLLEEGARAKAYELALDWLIDCGQSYRVFRVNKPAYPLKAYENRNAFKLFMVDIGLLAAMGDIDPKTLLEGNRIYSEFKGAMTEQYVFQQLVGSEDYAIYYWSAERSTAEIDFVVQIRNSIIPVEVKAEENLQAKSLKVYHDKFAPELAVRASLSDFRMREWLINLPLYAISQLSGLID